MKRKTMPKARVKAMLHQAEKAIANGGRGIDITHLSDEELKLQLRLAHKIMEEDRELLADPRMGDDWDGSMTVYFGQFGSMEYQPKDIQLLADHAARMPCRWCVGEGDPEMDCPCCKNTRRMWIGIV